MSRVQFSVLHVMAQWTQVATVLDKHLYLAIWRKHVEHELSLVVWQVLQFVHAHFALRPLRSHGRQ